MKIVGLILGTLLSASIAFGANGSGGAGKCCGEMKKEVKEKTGGSCGAGKCGAEMKKDVKGSCGAGKCGSESSTDKSKTK